MKSLFKTVFLIIIFSGITRVLGFVFRIWLSRTIGSEALGLYQISFSIFTVLLTLVSSGLPLVISRTTAKQISEKDKKGEAKTLTSALVISVGLAIVVSLLILIFQKPLSAIFADERCMPILICLLPALVFSAIYSSIRGNMWGHNNYLGVCSAELFEQIARIIICVLLLNGFWSLTEGAIGASLSLSIACLLSAIFVVILYVKKGGKFSKPSSYKPLIKQSTPITLVRVATSLVQPVIALIIPARLVAAGYTSSQALSLFGVATGMTMPLLFIPMTFIGALSMALIPDLSTAKNQNNNEHISSRINASILFSIIISCLLVPLYIGVGENVGLFFFDNAQSGILLSSSAWVMIPMCLTNISSSILNAVGLEIKSCKNYIWGAIIMLACLWFLPKYIGINALIWAMGLCFTISAVLNIRMIKKQVCPEIKFGKKFALMIAFMLPTMAIASFMTNLLNYVFPLFVNLALSCIIATVCYVLLCLI
ncbi:MAG: oligosaccharide flippase family protein, partial [Clostridia bacterium]|nr:oligosaccharide flippase family protein [Clostridia bacterium]